MVINVLHLFYSHGRGHELPGALAFVRQVLANRAYVDGTRYYERDCVLYFAARLLASADDAELHGALGDVVRARLQEAVGAPGDALALAMRVVACVSVGLHDEVDVWRLRPLQCEDGGWERGWCCRYGKTGIRMGNRGFTTVMAIKAIEEARKLKKHDGVGS